MGVGKDKTLLQTPDLAKHCLTSLDVRKLSRSVEEVGSVKMKIVLIAFLALAAVARADDSDNTMETAINFIKDCKGDYILCVKVHINFIIIKVKVLSENSVLIYQIQFQARDFVSG